MPLWVVRSVWVLRIDRSLDNWSDGCRLESSRSFGNQRRGEKRYGFMVEGRPGLAWRGSQARALSYCQVGGRHPGSPDTYGPDFEPHSWLAKTTFFTPVVHGR